MSKKFPDLTGDSKVTQADILKGRKVFADGGSLMVPVERKMYAKGRLVTSAMKMIKKAFESGNISEDAIKKADKIHFELEANDFAGTGRTTEKGKREMVAQEQGVTVDEVDIIETAFARASGGGESKSLIEELKMVGRALTTEPTRAQQRAATLGGTKETRESRIKAGKFGAAGAGVGSLLTGSAMSAWNMINDEPPTTEKEASDFEKAFSSAFKAGENTFEFDGKQYTTELKREAKSVGGILGKKLLSFAGAKASRDAPKVTAARKAAVADEEADRAAEMLEDALMEDPEFLDRMDPNDLEALMADLPPSYRAKLSPDMGDVQEDTLELLRGMDPSEVADNLQLFNSLGELKNYTQELNPRQTREFISNVSPEDYDMFKGFKGLIQELGPREMKAHGGTIGLLVPVEGMKPDGEMEDDYVSYVMDETLSDDEIEYVNKALESDDRLSELFDKIVLSSTEFTGAGEVDGPGTGTSDEIPARLSDGEFVFTKKAVDQIGVEKLEEMMKDAENEYDASRQDMALGGLMNDPTQDEKANLPDQAMEDEQIEEQMLDANRIPSLMRR
tara:strand:- start:731 stop:2419 length:1689 start_codon:yes stop_codon:yes gene_type:complete